MSAFDPASEALPRRLQEHLSRAWDTPVAVSGWRRFPGGMSWVTIGFTATVRGQARELIVRLGDPAGLFAPYRTDPEYLALSALAGVIPVPEVLLRCDDTEVLGAPFIVTARVAGDAPTPWNNAAGRNEAERESLGREFADILGALHAFDWRRTPLAAWSEGLDCANTAVREVRRWAAEAGHPHQPLPAALHYGMRWLEAHAPVAERIVLVHGDYRVGNFLREGGRITAVLDWELVHLGDPHEDLAWAGLRTFAPAGSPLVGGLIDRAEFYSRYSQRSGLAVDLAKIRYYEVMMQYKSAAMLLGASRRVQAGRASDVRMAAMGFQLAPTLMSMLRAMEGA